MHPTTAAAPAHAVPRAAPAHPLLHSAFYRFTPVADGAGWAQALRALADALNARAQADGTPALGGALIVAGEGLNGTVAGPAWAVAAFEAALQQGVGPGPALPGLVFKHSACQGAPFGRFKVSVKPEIVALGLAPGELTDAHGRPVALPPPDEHDTSHLSPTAWRALLARDDVVLLDNRNHFEWRLGHFRGAPDPQVQHFRDFVAHVRQHAPAWRAEQRSVAMYCTGGIRCDKTAPWMRSLGLEVWQLQGGVLNHFQTLPDAARDWQGACFVFDQRLALDTRLQPTGARVDEVYDPAIPAEAWRLQRAQRLAQAAGLPARQPAAPPPPLALPQPVPVPVPVSAPLPHSDVAP